MVKWVMKLLWRDAQYGRITAVFVCLSFSIYSMVALQLLSDALKRTTLAETSRALAADYILTGNQPLNDDVNATLASVGVSASTSVNTRTVIFNEESTQLVALKAVDGAYPLAPGLLTNTALDSSAIETDRGPVAGEVWVDREFLYRLGYSIGDQILVGRVNLPITRVIEFEPDRGFRFYSLVPRVMISEKDLPATGILHPASRVRYQTLIKGPESALRQLEDALVPKLDVHQTLKPAGQSSQALDRALDRAEAFYRVIGVVAALIASAALLLVIDRYVKRSQTTIAVVRCLGMTARQNFFCYAIQGSVLLVIALAVANLGAVASFLLLQHVASSVWGVNLLDFRWEPMLGACIGSIAIVTAIAQLKLAGIFKVPAVAAIRGLDESLDHLSTTPFRLWIQSGLLFLLGMASYVAAQEAQLVQLISALVSMLSVFILCYGLAFIYTKIIDKLLPSLPMAAQLAWRQSHTDQRLNRFQMALFTLIFVCVALTVVLKEDLFDRWQRQLPEGTANYFLINLFPEDLSSFITLLDERSIPHSTPYPVTRGRLVEINNTPVLEAVTKEQADQAEVLHRELNITWSSTIPEENEIVAGQWWQLGDQTESLVSVESELAEELGIKLGDTLGFSFQGSLMQAKVASLRSIEWDNFKPNFYMIFNPGALDDFSGTYMISLYIDSDDPDQRALAGLIVQRYPQVSLFAVEHILTQITGILDYVALAIYLTLSVVVVAAVLVLVSALLLSWDERLRSAAVFRTLGAPRDVLIRLTRWEYLLNGLGIGLLSAMVTEIVAAMLSIYLFSMKATFHPGLWISLVVVSILGMVLTGQLSQIKIVKTNPNQLLRTLLVR